MENGTRNNGTRNREGACRLCLERRPLQESHFLPAAVYRLLNPGDNRHVVIDQEKHYTTSKQTKEHLLCEECEQRFNSLGEKWVMAHGSRGKGGFRLQDVLRKSLPLKDISSGLVFDGATLPNVDMDRLCYFGTSVFWRAAAHKWRGQERIDLGPIYTEQFRRFLLGQDSFPANAVIVIHVSNADDPLAVAFFPTGEKVAGSFYWYSFCIPGLMYWLFVGGRIPDSFRSVCAVRSKGRKLFLTSRVEEFMQQTAINVAAGNAMIRNEILSGHFKDV